MRNGESMNITDRQIIARFEENGLRCERLVLQNGVSILISQHGGRIFGPFLPSAQGESPSIYWMNDIFADSQAFRKFIQNEEWNLGGDRIWIAPEIQYHVRDRQAFGNSLFWPRQVDPGSYHLEQSADDHWTLSQEMALEAFNLASGTKHLRLERRIKPAADPLRNLAAYHDLSDGVAFAGYEHEIALSEKSHDAIMSESWSLIQLQPGGRLLIPASPDTEFVNYLSPVGDLQSIRNGCVRLQITGRDQYKVGYKAAHIFGRAAYVNTLPDGRTYALIRNYPNHPSSFYAEEPAKQPGQRGCSLHVYNDNGKFGGFGELECNGMTIGGETGRSSSTDVLSLWLYVGTEEKIQAIIRHLLGVQDIG